jgi:16S rRNA (guanine527-N7)-methyltransferase
LRDERLDRWLTALVETPGLTASRDSTEARRVHLDSVLPAAELLGKGPVADVGSGGGSPGFPLAAARPDLQFDLLEATQKKCRFLERWAVEHGRGVGREAYGTAIARALASPEVAAEWCLPLARAGGRVLLFVGPSVDEAAVANVARALAAEIEDSPSGFVLMRKTGPTPERFPRRPGVARKRPLA